MDSQPTVYWVNRRQALQKGALTLAGFATLPPSTTKAAVTSGTRFKDKVVLITGATSGIGRATAQAFAGEGAQVMFCGRREQLGQEVAAAIKKSGGVARYLRADVREPDQIEAFVQACLQEFGRIDIAFNNAGVEGKLAEMHTLSLQDWETVMNTNLRGVWLSMKAEITQMRKQGGGAIVNTSSVQGLAANPGFTPYTASKHGILGLTKTAALENAQHNIRVNAIAPGPIDTAMTDRTLVGAPITKAQLANRVPVKRIGRPEEIAQVVMWLASNEAPFVTGAFLNVDGGVIAQE
jgi:NAD(P)-dependent dehydrogenase (short-subunit alcohol dehydrogenase family)